MARTSALLAAVGSERITTSELYDRMGYPTLVAHGLVSYHAFRAELARLSGAGLLAYESAPDGSTVWWRTATGDEATTI
jgi:hypothetical protein